MSVSFGRRVVPFVGDGRIAGYVGMLSAFCIGALTWTTDGNAVMAGAPPDTPSARVDVNVATSEFAGVGAVVVGGGTYSGVVIARQYVLTAGHVGTAGPASGMQFLLNINSSTWTTAVDSVVIHPSYSFPYDDLAVLRLSTPVPSNVPIYALFPGAVAAGLTITLAGYGSSGNGNVGVTVGANSAIKRTGANVIDGVQDTLDSSGRQSKFFIYDFDGPTGSGNTGGPTIGNASETLVAGGDSGGPSFVHTPSGLQLLGINTFVSPGVSGGPTDYKFGMLGGGIVAADARFIPWMQSATNGTIQIGADVGDAGDAPIPGWALAVLAGALLVVAGRHFSALREGAE